MTPLVGIPIDSRCGMVLPCFEGIQKRMPFFNSSKCVKLDYVEKVNRLKNSPMNYRVKLTPKYSENLLR